jgi:hypothetical protein
MKRNLLSIFAALTIGLSLNAQTKIYDFRFDNSLTASVGTGTFVSSGSSFITDRNGNANNSLSLTNQAIASLSNLPIGNSERTVSLWFKVPNAPSSAANIVRYGAFSGAGVFGVYLFGGYTFQTGGDDFLFTNNPPLNTWNHLLLTLSNNVVNIYFNGVLNTTVNNANLNTLLGDFQLGESGFSLEIDDLKIYNGALTPSQIMEVYTNNDLSGIQNYTISSSALPNNGGTITGVGTFEEGALVTLTATPNSNYQFVKWTENGNDFFENPFEFIISSNRNLVAVFEMTSGIENNFENNLFTVFPNPANENVTISNIEVGSTVSLIDVTGKIVSKVVANSTSVNVETSNFTPGVYFVTVSGLNGTQKLIIE